LLIDIENIKVTRGDFINAMKKITPACTDALSSDLKLACP
jgi:SpoVK/Ycf46/Vps4 family AAA+-type ATPase